VISRRNQRRTLWRAPRDDVRGWGRVPRLRTHTAAPVEIQGWEVVELYDGAVRLGFDRNGRATGFRHSYWLKVEKSADFPQGRKMIPGVTGVSGLLTEAAAGLSPWAARLAVKYLRDDCGIHITDEQADEAVKAHTDFRDRAAVNGTAVHKAVEDILDGKPEPAKPSLSYKRGGQVVALLEREGLRVLANEFKCFSLKHEYCGTGDLDTEKDGLGRAIIDLKTSKAFRMAHAMQLAAYVKAREEELGVKYADAGVICAKGKPRLIWLSDVMKMPGPQAIAAAHNAFLGLLAVKTSIPDIRNFGRDH
jgi:hypothetical protein